MVQRLMRALNPAALERGLNRLDALALAGKNKPLQGAINGARRSACPKLDAKCSKQTLTEICRSLCASIHRPSESGVN